MRETITMTSTDQKRSMLLTKLLVGEITVAQTAMLMGVSERQVWRLKSAFERAGPSALVHGNRGRASPRRLPDATRTRILELAAGRYAGLNDSHLADLLAEEEGIIVSRVAVRRILRAAGIASPRRRRSPRHRSRRERMPQAGLLVQLDGSRHDWLEGRGPWLSLIGAIDDATGVVTGATFRDQEDAAGYLVVLRETVRRHGIPAAVYRARHTIFETAGNQLTLEEQLVDRRTPTQVGRALDELGITSIAARSPQAKGRIERLWGHLPGPPGGRAAPRRRGRPGSGRARAGASSGASQPPLQRRAGRSDGGLASAPIRAPAGAGVLSQVPPRGGQRPHRPGRGDDPPIAARTGPPRLRREARRGPPAPRRPARGVGR
ncbi:MAG: ISNCY family transposase [Chloroflexota bacterium]